MKTPNATRSLSSHSVHELCNPTAMKVKIQATTGENIQIFEIGVFSKDDNVAVGKSASQSSVLKHFVASRAVDNDTNTFSHTSDADSWLEVDLGGTFSVKSIKIENRWCIDENDSPGCLCRLSNANLSLFDASGVNVLTLSTGNTCGMKTLEYVFEPTAEFCSEDAPVVPSPSPQNGRKLWQDRILGKRPSKC